MKTHAAAQEQHHYDPIFIPAKLKIEVNSIFSGLPFMANHKNDIPEPNDSDHFLGVYHHFAHYLRLVPLSTEQLLDP